jgi:hypothetical protein
MLSSSNSGYAMRGQRAKEAWWMVGALLMKGGGSGLLFQFGYG